LATPERMFQVANLIARDTEPKIVVLSAVSGTTNSLVSIGDFWFDEDQIIAQEVLETLHQQYIEFNHTLLGDSEWSQRGDQLVEDIFHEIKGVLSQDPCESGLKKILAQGEMLSTNLFNYYLHGQMVPAVDIVPALKFMVIDEHGEPELERIAQRLKNLISQQPQINTWITQGFICMNHQEQIDNLKRGGSDYTASIIGAAIQAQEIQIWTDIDGMHNNDPRVVEQTFPIARLTFEEAAELAYFGAKILHSSTIRPAQQYNIPVRLLNTMLPEATGTLIGPTESGNGVKSIAVKDNITAIKIKSTRMLLAFGFLRKLFEVFEKYKTPIDMITTSEVAVSLTIDNDTYLPEILAELETFGTAVIDREQSIICIVGQMVADKKGIVRKIFDSLDNVPLRMISYGGSKNNISLLVDTNYKVQALNALNRGIFHQELKSVNL